MSSIKFYYSTSLKIATQTVLVSNSGQVVGVGDIIGPRKDFPRVTICGILNDNADEMVFGACRCSTKDTFSKEKGRQLSFGRAICNPYRKVKIPKNAKIPDIFMENCREIEEEIMRMIYPIFKEPQREE